MPDAFDYKKEFPDLYKPGKKPMLINVPEMRFFTVAGAGDPNAPGGAYADAVSLLYALSFTVKMSKMGPAPLPGYFDYVVPPLEGLWWMEGGAPGIDYAHKERFNWISMIRQPEFVTDEIFSWACLQVEKKKGLDTAPAKLTVFTEGLCVQCLHVGPFDDEPATVAKIDAFIEEKGLVNDISDTRHHHEIYLSDPRKCTPSKNRAILRHPVRKI